MGPSRKSPSKKLPRHRVTAAFRAHVRRYSKRTGIPLNKLGRAAGWPFSTAHVQMFLYVSRRDRFPASAQMLDRIERLARCVDFTGKVLS